MLIALYISPLGSPVHFNAISTSLGSIHPRCNYWVKTIRSHIHHCLWPGCHLQLSELKQSMTNCPSFGTAAIWFEPGFSRLRVPCSTHTPAGPSYPVRTPGQLSCSTTTGNNFPSNGIEHDVWKESGSLWNKKLACSFYLMLKQVVLRYAIRNGRGTCIACMCFWTLLSQIYQIQVHA